MDQPRRFPAQWIAIGIALGAGVGVAMKNVPIGVGIGAVFGVLVAALHARRR